MPLGGWESHMEGNWTTMIVIIIVVLTTAIIINGGRPFLTTL